MTNHLRFGGQELVLRKKPPGKLLRGAHMIEREYQVMKALGTAGVPVPECLALCEDESVCGTPFYIMRYIHGRVLKNATLLFTIKHCNSTQGAFIYYYNL